MPRSSVEDPCVAIQAEIAHIQRFIAEYNDDAHPFVWTESVVHQKRLKPCCAV